MVAEAAALGLFMVAPGMDLPPKTPAPAKNSDALPPPGNPGDDILGFGEENKEQTKKKKITVKRLCFCRKASKNERERESMGVLVMWCEGLK